MSFTVEFKLHYCQVCQWGWVCSWGRRSSEGNEQYSSISCRGSATYMICPLLFSVFIIHILPHSLELLFSNCHQFESILPWRMTVGKVKSECDWWLWDNTEQFLQDKWPMRRNIPCFICFKLSIGLHSAGPALSYESPIQRWKVGVIDVLKDVGK